MKSTFTNIDNTCVKLNHEPLGDIQPKYWFKLTDTKRKLLVKRQHSFKVEEISKKSRAFNHIGEYFGYLIAQKAGIDACPVELITLHDTKNKYAKTKRLYTACGSIKAIGDDKTIILGEVILNRFKFQNSQKADEIKSNPKSDLKKGNIMTNDENDNVDFVINSIISETLRYERAMRKKSEEEIKQDINENISKIIDTVAYDCIFANNDRHSFNWAVFYDDEKGKVQVYPNYDNERVLGLSKTEYEVKKAINSGIDLSSYHETELFSRMGIYPINSGVTYKNMLNHIVENYSEYAIPSIQKITSKVDSEYIEKLYDSVIGISKRGVDAEELSEEDELPIEYRILGLNLFKERREFALDLIRKRNICYNKENAIKREEMTI